jgi:recombination protein RecR
VDSRGIQPIERLIDAFRKLPSIGPKSAARLTYFLLAAPEAISRELGEALTALRQEVTVCEECFNLTQRSPCAVCADEARTPQEICVVEEPADVGAIEAAGAFHGRYHILGGALSPLDGAGPDSLRVRPLLDRVRRDGVREVIIATNPSTEGEATAVYLARQLAPLGVTVTRIGYGMPIGGDLEYTDALTIRKSIEARREFRA